MALSAAAQDYFRSINPLATKIHEDIEDAKNAYESIWETLSDKERVRKHSKKAYINSRMYVFQKGRQRR